MKRYQLNAVVEVHDHLDKSDLRAYVRDALASYGGALPPQDPRFDGAKTIGTIKLTKLVKSAQVIPPVQPNQES